MAAVHGKGSVFKIDNAAGTITDITTYVDDISFPMKVAMAESTTMGKEDSTYVSGVADRTISIKGKWDSTAVSGEDVVLNGLVGLEVTSTFEYGPEGSASGKVKYTGECFLTMYSVSSPLAGVVAFSADFQVSGALTRTTWP